MALHAGVTVNVDDIVDVLRGAGLSLCETLTLPGRDAQYSPVPDDLHAELGKALRDHFSKGLYSHQTTAIRVALSGRDVCLATPTASGKSLVFMTVAAQLALANASARILAIYPAKALIQDQLSKWQSFLDPFAIRVGFIDGSIPTANRPSIISSCRVIAMTPDVAHAWLMSHLAVSEVADFLRHLSLLVLDEAHVYDGAFGTNMAYFLRRLARHPADISWFVARPPSVSLQT